MAKIIEQKTEKTEPLTPPIWERVQQRMNQVPESDMAQLPTDAAEEHDHYLYGTPKRDKPLEKAA